MAMTRDDALKVVTELSREDRKVLLKTLVEEMDSDDAEEVLNEQGYVGE